MSNNLECTLTDVNNINFFELEVFEMTDSIGANIIKHQFLGRDGAMTQVVGTKPRTITFKTYWFGDNYFEHFDFLDYVDSIKSGVTFFVLQHPIYGNVTGRIENWPVKHDDRINYAEIDITFVEDLISIENGTPAVFNNAVAILNLDNVTPDYNTYTGLQLQTLGYGNLLGKLFDPTKTISSQLQGYSVSIRNFGSDIDNNLAALNTFVQSFTVPLMVIPTTVTTLVDIPTFIYNQFVNATNQIVQVFSSTSQLFDIKSITSSFTSIANIFTGQNAPFFKSAWYQVSTPPDIQCHMQNISSDVQNRQTIEAALNQQTFDVLGNLVSQINTSAGLVSLSSIQSDTNLVKTYAENAINYNPSGYTIKNMLVQLQSYFNSVQQQFIKTYQITISPQPLAALLMVLGKDYHEADEFLALNPQILNPNNVSGTVTVYA
jgi:hypothetical protein